MRDANSIQTLADCLHYMRVGDVDRAISLFPEEVREHFPKELRKIHLFHIEKNGLSINQIVALANTLTGEHLSATTIQNWTKREVRKIIGVPRVGKKYSLQQATIIYLLDDLKHLFSLEETSSLLALIFNNPDRDEDDLISPIDFYRLYAEYAKSTSPIEMLDTRAKRSIEKMGYTHSNIMHVLKLCLYAHRVTTLELEAKHYLSRFI
ncbi:hypothetical protein L479_02159 [Exiguobacterium sp. S17]|nr:hypothetical protein L479_02159 [Exiguobacterium sp. S17]